MEFTHIEGGKSKVVDISKKENVIRKATAEGRIKLRDITIQAIIDDKIAKGNVFGVATTAAILAVKKTPELIPMCHFIPITSIKIDFQILGKEIKAQCEVKSVGKTGVEMEAITGVSVALLTIWDMVKSMEKDETGNYPQTVIKDIVVTRKEKNEKETA